KLVSSLEENINKSIDKILTDFNKIQEKNNEIGLKIEDLNQKYEDFVNLVNNISDRITSIFIKPDQETEQMEYTENLPFDLNKLIELMNRPDLQAENLFIKSGNRPILKSPRATAAIGKTSLKNGDVFNFITQLFNPNEIKHLQIQGNINKIKTINNEKYYLNAQKILDNYVLVIKKIPYATNDISILPIVNPEKLISKISNLVLFLGVNNLKNTALSTLVNYINQKQIKRIAIIEEKINYLYKELQSIIDIFEHKGNEDNLIDTLKKVLNDEYDIIILSSNSLDKKIVKMVANYSSYKTFILNLGHDNIVSFYKEYKDISEDILKSLNIYITHKSIRNELHLLEIVFIDNKIKGLIKSEDHKAIREYIISIEESDTQTFNESIAYLVKTGKITKEEAMKYLSNLDEIEKSVKQEQQIEL
ncbi:MAG: type IV pilus twitching motility protein PilT, partial [Candidatus Calescibacterium sp.]|nr:type IV pilus twitching motility protein PilT [Candidatus Calescibacterium sp.]